MVKRAIVTGASSGIGLATAELLAAGGVELVLSGRNADRLKAVTERLREQVRCEMVVGDLTNVETASWLAGTAQSMGDAYPVLINSAGIAEFGEFAATGFETFEAQIAANLLGPARVCHSVLPWMLAQRAGQIVNVLSITAIQTVAGSSGYSSAKAGMHMLGKILAAEYRKKGIRVTSILPGAVDTPIWEGKSFVPKREDMLPVLAVAETIAELVLAPPNRTVDELVIMPPKGFL